MDIKYIERNTDSTVEYYDSTESTNDRAKIIAEKYIKNEKNVEDRNGKKRNFANLIITEEQTRGKGTNGRKWFSDKEKNILMTMIFYPQINANKLDGITYKIAEMVKLAIKDLFDIELTIKLPNDLLLNNRKISGILTESSIREGRVSYLLVGIGLNVNQTEFSKELNGIATSLKKEYYEKEYKREDIIIKIFNNVKSLI